jgi:hypothetical protein
MLSPRHVQMSAENFPRDLHHADMAHLLAVQRLPRGGVGEARAPVEHQIGDGEIDPFLGDVPLSLLL